MTFGELYGGAARRTTAATMESYRSSCAEESRLVNDDEADYSSGASTPPLWRAATDCPASPAPARQGTSNDESHYRSLSPASRAQAIARGQRELMEMVNRMPEGCYELSLKDLVEHQLQIGIDPDDRQEEKIPERNSINNGNREIDRNSKLGKKKKSDISEKSNYNPAAAKMTRSGSLDNGGFLLKMGCPVYSLRSRSSKKKKQKQKQGKGGSVVGAVAGGSPKDGRVSPRPLLVNGSSGPAAAAGRGGGGAAESEWWNDGSAEAEAGESCESAAGFSSSSNSNNSRSSKSSHGSSGGSRGGGGGRRNNDRRRSGLCCLFSFSSKGRVVE